MESEQTEQKLPKNCKENRYYYRHREEILEKKRLKRLEDPEYQAKQLAKEEAKKNEEEKKLKMKEIAKEKSRERAKKKAELLGILPVVPSGVEENQS
jgi:hypothetical protein